MSGGVVGAVSGGVTGGGDQAVAMGKHLVGSLLNMRKDRKVSSAQVGRFTLIRRQPANAQFTHTSTLA
jgi:hypothetical protein